MVGEDVRCCESPLGIWLASLGGGFHPSLVFRSVPSLGTSVFASSSIPCNSKDEHGGVAAVSCPLSAAIQPKLVRHLLHMTQPMTFSKSVIDKLSDHQIMATYLALHRVSCPSDHASHLIGTAQEAVTPIPVANSTNFASALQHQIYVSTLPTDAGLCTPHYYRPEERLLIESTNAGLEAIVQLRQWKAEFSEVEEILMMASQKFSIRADSSEPPSNPNTLTSFPFDSYIWASVILSSRAFPSRCIDGDVENSTPVLFPGVDTMNHNSKADVLWMTNVHTKTTPLLVQISKDLDSPSNSASHSDRIPFDQGALELILNYPLLPSEQAFNNYGQKPNEELLLSYGFTIPDNPADGFVLKFKWWQDDSPWLNETLEIMPIPDEELRHVIHRNGEIPEALLAQMRLNFCLPEDVSDFEDECERVRVRVKRENLEYTPNNWKLNWKDHFFKVINQEVEEQVWQALYQNLQMKEVKVGFTSLPQHKPVGVREQVWIDIVRYKQSQSDILNAAIGTIEKKMSESGWSILSDSDDNSSL